MILISSEVNDFSTNEVIEWLLYYSKEFIRINKNDKYNIEFLSNGTFLIFDDKKINLNKIVSFWHRRGKFQLDKGYINNDSEFGNYSIEENEIITNYLNIIIGKNQLNNFYTNNLNKLVVNNFAKSFGIEIPRTYLLTSKTELKEVMKLHPIITKGITQSSVFENVNSNDIFMSYTNEITENNLFRIPEVFSPSLFQELIKKKIELRVFFLNNEYWSMAIFSQSDKKTEVDYRRYNKEKPNRTVPFNLPETLKSKISKLIKKIGINSGSIDFMVEQKTNKYYFLEINPIGQFGMVSYPCNYNLEKKIAKFLSNE